MPRITITGLDSRVDGSYDLDLEDSFNGNELHLIKKYAGVRVGEISEAMGAGDYDLVVCLTKIAIDRSGKDVPMERLMEAKVGAIQFEQTDAEKAADEEADRLPPASAPSGANENKSGPITSGVPSGNGSDSTPESDQSDIGSQDLLTGSGYSQAT